VAGSAGDRPPGGGIRQALNHQAPQGRVQLPQPLQGDRAAPGTSSRLDLGRDQGVEDLGLVAQELGRPQHVGRRRRVDPGELGEEAMTDPVAGEALVGVGAVLAPAEAARLAIPGRLRPGGAQQRPGEAAVVGAHPKQGAAARR